MRFKVITQDNKGVAKFLKFTKLMDLIIAPSLIQFDEEHNDYVYYSFLQKKIYSCYKYIKDVEYILVYLAIRYDFNHFNEYLDLQEFFKTNLIKNKLLEEIKFYYDIDIFCLYFVKLKTINFLSGFNLKFYQFIHYDNLLNNIKLGKKTFSSTCLNFDNSCQWYFEYPKTIFNNVKFTLNSVRRKNYNFDELPLALIKIPSDTREDVTSEMVYQFLVNFYFFKKRES